MSIFMNYCNSPCIRYLCHVAAVGYVFYFSSERVFWSFLRPDDNLAGLVLGWLLYCTLAHIFLVIWRYYKVQRFWGVFLTGCIFGWLVEGGAVFTLYGVEGIPFPITILWTSVSWHSIISVVFGWYIVGKALKEGNVGKLIRYSLAYGIFWGLWATAWALETPPLTVTPEAFFSHGLVNTILFMVSHWIINKLPCERIPITKWQMLSATGIPLIVFTLHTIPSVPWALFVLPPLVFGALLMLQTANSKKHLSLEHPCDLFKSSLRHYAILLIMPVIATVIYTVMNHFVWLLPTNFLFFLFSTFLGGLLLLLSPIMIRRERSLRH